MAATITHRRNTTPAAVPDPAALQLGEFAINTADGELFFTQLIAPTQPPTGDNLRIFAVRRPPNVDGGEVIAPATPAAPTDIQIVVFS